MMIIGCDYHPAFQQIAFVDTDPGELQEQRLQHREETEKFYRNLAAQGMKVRVGMEANGHARWLERLLAELQFELWIGDASEIRSKRVRKQKTDRQDCEAFRCDWQGRVTVRLRRYMNFKNSLFPTLVTAGAFRARIMMITVSEVR
jgi:transposase